MLLWLTFERLPLSRVAERFGNLGITFRPSDIFRIFQASSPCLHVYHSWSFILLSEITSETGVVYVLLIYHACLSSYFYIPLLNLPSQTSTKFLIHGLLQYLLNRIPCQRSTLRRKNSLARHPGCRGSLTSAASWLRGVRRAEARGSRGRARGFAHAPPHELHRPAPLLLALPSFPLRPTDVGPLCRCKPEYALASLASVIIIKILITILIIIIIITVIITRYQNYHFYFRPYYEYHNITKKKNNNDNYDNINNKDKNNSKIIN